MEQILDILKKCEIFRDIPEEMLEECVIPQGVLREIPKEKYLIGYQEQVDSFAVVLSGKVTTHHIFGDGSYTIIDAIEEYEILGGDLMWTRSRVAPYYAVAAQPLQLLYFPICMVTEPGYIPEECRLSIMSRMLTMISHANIRKEYRLAILSQKGLRERIMIYLTMQANKRGTPTFEIPFTREELASFLCVNRSSLSHELSLMKQEGILDFRKNRFTLLTESFAAGQYDCR